MESVQGLQSSVHQMNSEKLNIEKSLQERVSMEKEVNDLKTKNIALEKDSEVGWTRNEIQWRHCCVMPH